MTEQKTLTGKLIPEYPGDFTSANDAREKIEILEVKVELLQNHCYSLKDLQAEIKGEDGRTSINMYDGCLDDF